jgi:hypothetical protein
MKRKYLALVAGGTMTATLAGLAVFSLVMAAHPSRASAAASCTPTGFSRDNINLTAALINPSGTVSGTVDATGCNIGVFYSSGVQGLVNNADIFGANYFGVVNDGGAVTVENSSIHDIGETPLNGSQHGVGIYWVYGSDATGSITDNSLWNYQKGGIVVNGVGSSAQIRGNTVTGKGHVNYIAQNGIQIGYGATATVMGNTVSDNSYTGANYASSGGILVVGGPGYSDAYTTNLQIVGNTLSNNDVGVWLSNLDLINNNYVSPTTPTNIKVVNNTISNDGVFNISGYTYPALVGYQAGVSDMGDNDKIIHNNISGVGYTPDSNIGAYLIQIDADPSFTNNAKIHANVIR